jgi:hypothetical protein
MHSGTDCVLKSCVCNDMKHDADKLNVSFTMHHSISEQ